MSDSLRPGGLTVARMVPLSIGFSRQEYWNWLPFPDPGDPPNLEILEIKTISSALAAGFFTRASLLLLLSRFSHV